MLFSSFRVTSLERETAALYTLFSVSGSKRSLIKHEKTTTKWPLHSILHFQYFQMKQRKVRWRIRRSPALCSCLLQSYLSGTGQHLYYGKSHPPSGIDCCRPHPNSGTTILMCTVILCFTVISLLPWHCDGRETDTFGSVDHSSLWQGFSDQGTKRGWIVAKACSYF